MYMFNTCFMVYIVHYQHSLKQVPGKTELSKKSRDTLLVYDIHLLLLFTALFDPIYKLMDPFMWFRILWRNHVSALPP